MYWNIWIYSNANDVAIEMYTPPFSPKKEAPDANNVGQKDVK